MAFYEGNYGPVDPGVIGCEFHGDLSSANLQFLTTCTKLRPMRISARELHLPVKSASCDWFVGDFESGPHRGGVGSECVHRCAIRASLTSKILDFKNLLGSTNRRTTNYF